MWLRYGLSQEECTDNPCGALIGVDGILKDPLALAAAEQETGRTAGGLAAGFTVMNDIMVEYVDSAVQQREADFPAVLTVNRKSNGQLFTCRPAGK